MNALTDNVEAATSQESVKLEIDADLSNLIYLFKDAVIKAINLELPFIGSVTYFNETLKKSIEGKSFRKFIEDNIRDIHHQEFTTLDDQASKREIKSKIVNEMNSLLVKLERGI